MPSLDDATKLAMELSESDRAALAEALLESLPEPPPAIEEAEFVRMMSERAEAYDHGETTAIGWRESVERMRARFEAEFPNAAQN